MKRKQDNNINTVSKKQKIDRKISIDFINGINDALKKFHERFGNIFFEKNLAAKCYEFCSLHFTNPVQYTIYCKKCIKYINVVHLFLEEILWTKVLKKQFLIKGYTFYRGGNLLGALKKVKEKYKTKHYLSNLNRRTDRFIDFTACIQEYNLLMNENLMGLESGTIKQIPLTFRTDEEIEDDILKTASQLV